MTIDIDRRDIIRAGLIAGAAATASVIERPAFAQTATTGTKPTTYDPKPLSIDPKSINGISEKVLVSHYENTMSAR